jgi:hypothetical protein
MAYFNGVNVSNASQLVQLVAADGSSGGFIKDSQVSAFALTLLDDAAARNFAATAGLLFPLGQSSVAVSHTGNTDETVLATVTIPAGAIGPNGQLLIQALWAFTGTNTKTPRIRLGGIGGSIFYAAAHTTNLSCTSITRIGNRNAANSQVAGVVSIASGVGASASGVFTAAVDTSAEVTLVFTGQLTNTGEAISIESYFVGLQYAA